MVLAKALYYHIYNLSYLGTILNYMISTNEVFLIMQIRYGEYAKLLIGFLWEK